MDPARSLIHLGLKVTETALDRAVGIVRLADTLLVASAAPDVREGDGERSWPAEEEGDLDAVSDALRAKAPAKKGPAKKSPAKKSPAKKAPAKKAPAKKAPAKKSPAKKSTSADATLPVNLPGE